jgi:hypothetical protein
MYVCSEINTDYRNTFCVFNTITLDTSSALTFLLGLRDREVVNRITQSLLFVY